MKILRIVTLPLLNTLASPTVIGFLIGVYAAREGKRRTRFLLASMLEHVASGMPVIPEDPENT